MNTPSPDIVAVESLLAFWADAGVEACYEDAAVDRTYVPPPAQKAVALATASVVAAPDTGAALAEARRLATACQTLDDVAAAIAAFQGCPLSTLGARQAVFGRGDPAAPVLVIGEGPGAEEDTQGQPFVGKAGRLLDRMLAAAGLTDRVFITNTVFWRPPGNRVPTPQEQAVCAPFVERTLAIMKPEAVLLLGASAARGVLGAEEGILKLRGEWKDWRLAEGDVSAPVLPTLHPAFLLRQPMAKRLAWQDMLSLAARVNP